MKKEFEQKLNRDYNLNYDDSHLIRDFSYMMNKSRGKHCTLQTIKNHVHQGRAGTLLRKYDSIAFEVAYNESRRK
jgi:hypothetical protein